MFELHFLMLMHNFVFNVVEFRNLLHDFGHKIECLFTLVPPIICMGYVYRPGGRCPPIRVCVRLPCERYAQCLCCGLNGCFFTGGILITVGWWNGSRSVRLT